MTINSYCNKCRCTFTFTTTHEKTAWFARHPRAHKVEGRR